MSANAARAETAPAGAAPAGGPVRLVVSSPAVALPLGPADAAAVDTLAARAARGNVAAGVVPAPPAAGGEAAAEEPGWWTRSVSGPFGAFLRRTVGQTPREDATSAVGATGAVTVRLSGPPPPRDELVVHVNRDDGSAGLNVVAGERLAFTSANWSRPATVVFQADPRLRGATTATFTATAGDLRLAWSATFWAAAALFFVFALYHRLRLPRPVADRPAADGTASGALRTFFDAFAAFFRKPGVGAALLFILFYRFAESQQQKLGTPLMLDAREAGGLALSTASVGVVYGTVGILALTLGGILGGVLVSRHGLRRWFWPMVAAMNLPNLVYVGLAAGQPESLLVVNAAVALEQFGYGLGFTAFMLYLIHFADGAYKTAHYAICTGFMALGMMIPGMFSGWLQEILGYERFFVWVMLATIPSFAVAALIRFPPEFGRKRRDDEVRAAETPGRAIDA